MIQKTEGTMKYKVPRPNNYCSTKLKIATEDHAQIGLKEIYDNILHWKPV